MAGVQTCPTKYPSIQKSSFQQQVFVILFCSHEDDSEKYLERFRQLSTALLSSPLSAFSLCLVRSKIFSKCCKMAKEQILYQKILMKGLSPFTHLSWLYSKIQTSETVLEMGWKTRSDFRAVRFSIERWVAAQGWVSLLISIYVRTRQMDDVKTELFMGQIN